MTFTSKVRDAYERGGLPEVVVVARRKLAHWISPDPMPQPKRAAKPAPKPVSMPASQPAAPKPAPVHQADSVSLDSALAWFAPRRDGYVKLAQAVAPFVKPDAVIFDVGANIGYFTKVLSETLGFRGTAHLFEPLPNLVSLCKENLRDVDFDVRIHGFGLSDEPREIDLFIDSTGNLGWNTIIADKTYPGMIPVRIELRTIEEAGIDVVPSFIKVDVEGAEYQVLAGMMTMLESAQNKPAILCEVGWGTNHPHWEEELRVFNQLIAMGYTVNDIDMQPINIEELTRTSDVLLVHKG